MATSATRRSPDLTASSRLCRFIPHPVAAAAWRVDCPSPCPHRDDGDALDEPFDSRLDPVHLFATLISMVRSSVRPWLVVIRFVTV